MVNLALVQHLPAVVTTHKASRTSRLGCGNGIFSLSAGNYIPEALTPVPLAAHLELGPRDPPVPASSPLDLSFSA